MALTRKSPRRKKEKKSHLIYVFMYLLVVATIFFGALSYKVDINRKTNELRRSAARAENEIAELERDIQSLRLAREQLSDWKNVRRKIAEYKMPFRASEPRQVRYFSVQYRNGVNDVAAENSNFNSTNSQLGMDNRSR
jgi:hypothetical protein